ncbi:MAG: 4Fe-4S dicluster domain-containing protein [Anaerolineae bacterium]
MRERHDMKTAVLLCADLERLGCGLDLQEVQRWLRESVPGVSLCIVPDLEHAVETIAAVIAADNIVRLVLGLCSEMYLKAELQVAARRAGLDPLGIEAAPLGTYLALTRSPFDATEGVKVLLAAAVAKARAFSGSRPEDVKPHLPAKTSRRALLTLPPLEYRPVASIREDRCAAGSGCGLCAQVCPCGALEKVGGRIRLYRARCDGCGLCLTACPREAVQFPGLMPAQLEAQFAALLDPAVGALPSRGILFICQKSALVLEKLAGKGLTGSESVSLVSDQDPVSLPVKVPCVGIVPPTWILSCLASGAAAVSVMRCPGRCSFAQEQTIEGRVAYCRELLQGIGGSPDRVRLLQVRDVRKQGSEGAEVQAEISLSVPAASSFRASFQTGAETILQLAEAYGGMPGFSLTHAYSPFGLIEVADGCTSCGVCADACLAGALALEREDDGPSLTFDAALCMACGQCLLRCPEAANRVLRLQPITDLERLLQGRSPIHRDKYLRCERCGAPIASEAMLTRIGAVLGEENTSLLSLVTRYCRACRKWPS